MGRIAVAVPTRNRAELLRESLICLKAQTAANFDVLVLDNASTDHTAVVFRECVGEDSRFRYHRHSEMLPAVENFLSALPLMESEFFMWRADDDLSSYNFIDRLAQALQVDAGADLAICPLVRWHMEPERRSLVPLPPFPAETPIDRTVHLMRHCRPTWIYGLWRRAALVANFARIGDRYPFTWAWDHLLMMPTILAGRVTIDQEALFTQRVQRTVAYGLPAAQRLEARARYAEICWELLQDIHLPNERRADLDAALEFHFDDRVAPLKQMKRRALRERVLATLGWQRH